MKNLIDHNKAYLVLAGFLIVTMSLLAGTAIGVYAFTAGNPGCGRAYDQLARGPARPRGCAGLMALRRSWGPDRNHRCVRQRNLLSKRALLCFRKTAV